MYSKNKDNSKPDNLSSRKFHVFDQPVSVASEFADLMMEWIEAHPGNKFHLAISGGSTPNLLFASLAEKYPDKHYWQKVHFWWVDERMVGTDHPESNFGTAQKWLFSKINISPGNLHRIKGECDAAAEVESYALQIKEQLNTENGIPHFDLVLLGMGDDGHTASIFPDQMYLLDSEEICEIAYHPLTGQKRITLTGRVINQAEKICFLVTGRRKAHPIAEIRSNTEQAHLFPAYHIKTSDWYVDAATFSPIQ